MHEHHLSLWIELAGSVNTGDAGVLAEASVIGDSVMRQLCFVLVCFVCVPAMAQEPKLELNADLSAAIDRAGQNKPQLLDALERVPAEQKEGMEFLIRWMPERDLKSLTADFLLENVKLAYQVRTQTPWGKQIPKSVFLNDVLPYANVNEPRHPWRKDFLDRFMPVVAECKTPSEVAQKLNQTVFKTLNVKYSRKRKKADQSPKESMESGLASCTGLSIVLSDACRAVGVPARLVGIPKWANKPGNHTWIEVWDKDWQFTGAAEPSAKGLNHTWFQRDAAQAQADSKMSAIYAASFKKTGTNFPLIWAPRTRWVNAVNVTNRYTPAATENAVPRLMIRVWNTDRSARVAANVNVAQSAPGEKSRTGRSRNEGFDTNDILTFDVDFNQTYVVTVSTPKGSTVTQNVEVGEKKQVIVDVVLPRVTGS